MISAEQLCQYSRGLAHIGAGVKSTGLMKKERIYLFSVVDEQSRNSK